MQTIAAFIIGLLSTVPLLAYSSPGEVFPDLEIPVAEEQPQEPEPAMQEQVSSSSVSTSSAMSQEESSSSAVSSAYTSSSSEATTPGSPTFYRSGEKVEPTTEPVKEPAEEENIFNEPEPVAEPEVIEEEVPEVNEEELTDEELLQLQEEALQKEQAEQEAAEAAAAEEAKQTAAPKQSMLFSFIGQLKYILGAVGLAIAGLFYWISSKKQPAATSTTEGAVPMQSDVPKAPTNTNVEESSERLEHALNAIGQQGEDQKE